VTHAFVTVAIPFACKHVHSVNRVLGSLGNPAQGPVAAALEAGAFVHFVSMVVVHREGDARAHLILEASADGRARGACARLAETIGDFIIDILRSTGPTVSREYLGDYLEAHRLNVGPSWFSTPGVVFTGTLGMSVRRIKEEARLASWISAWLQRHPQPQPALQKLRRLRDEIFESADLKWAFVAEPVPLLGKPASLLAAWPAMLVSSVRDLLWPLLVLPLLAAIAGGILRRSCVAALRDAALVAVGEILFAVVGLVIAYLWLRRQEATDAPRDREPKTTAVAQIMAGENIVMQNHLAGASTLKPGRVHRMMLRLVFWLLDAMVTYVAQPGLLSGVGTIHFARWFILPRTDTLLFLSNYDGSWESYLEDFIARAHKGLSAIWSNTRNFPKTTNLVVGGASDGERFKRWARRQQHPTHFWFAAYPNLTVARIRTNAAIRHGFASAATEEAAAQWLHHFGFPTPPDSPLQSEMIPTLVFGALSPLKHAHCLIVKLAGRGPGDCRDWLRTIAPDLCYGERVPPNCAVVAGFGADGLRKLGLDKAALATFPTVFQQGMTAPWRARALGDTGANAPEQWLWGGPGKESDAIVLLYAEDPARLQNEVLARTQQARQYGHIVIHQIALRALPQNVQETREPFGFLDGISQPVIRGTRRGTAQRNDNQVVEPGEIILGYRDNLGYVAPMPEADGFPIGPNGTFLVARQLEQDLDGFEHYLDAAAPVVAADPRSPNENRFWIREWIAAKMVGRWREDGSSLVMHPTPPGTPGRTTVERDNDFLFGVEDPDGLRCPFGAHMRRANPRDSFAPGSQVQIGITNRHRILRVGRAYDGKENGCGKPGLLFMCLNTDIEGQFEFLQQTWVLGRDFSGLENETDPIVGHHQDMLENPMSIPTPSGALRVPPMQDFVSVRGGGYFFMPGRRTVDFLTQL